MSESHDGGNRAHPRYRASLPVDVTRYRASLPVNINGLPLHTNNISLSGLQISCPSLMLAMLGDGLEGNTLQVDLTLAGQGKIMTECEVVYVSDYGEEYLIGLHFNSFDGSGQSVYKEYIDSLSQKLP
ncbi:MAG: PilZ domain-containing protein [Gammaproteobacteria bacterium]|nr:MAG: PilZ domain-containing protein [Gammaproteobacteria bacterium]